MSHFIAGGIHRQESWSCDAGRLVERSYRLVIHREISGGLCPPTLWRPRGAKNTAQEKCCLTPPSLVSRDTQNRKPSENLGHPPPRLIRRLVRRDLGPITFRNCDKESHFRWAIGCYVYEMVLTDQLVMQDWSDMASRIAGKVVEKM